MRLGLCPTGRKGEGVNKNMPRCVDCGQTDAAAYYQRDLQIICDGCYNVERYTHEYFRQPKVREAIEKMLKLQTPEAYMCLSVIAHLSNLTRANQDIPELKAAQGAFLDFTQHFVEWCLTSFPNLSTKTEALYRIDTSFASRLSCKDFKVAFGDLKTLVFGESIKSL